MKSNPKKATKTQQIKCFVNAFIQIVKSNLENQLATLPADREQKLIKDTRQSLKALETATTQKAIERESRIFFEAAETTPTDFIKNYSTLTALYFKRNGIHAKRYYKDFEGLPCFIFDIKGLKAETIFMSADFYRFRKLYTAEIKKGA